MVEYFKIEGLDKKMFKCELIRATLSQEGCASNWQQAQKGDERRGACRSCPIGAKHAGFEGASCSDLKGVLICSRCSRPPTRGWLLDGCLCVSCKNREYEFVKGKNAKGSVPSKMLPLAPRVIMIAEAGVPKLLKRSLTQHDGELPVSALRDCQGEVTFMPNTRAAQQFRQGGLF
jgi:hypothetical protein